MNEGGFSDVGELHCAKSRREAAYLDKQTANVAKFRLPLRNKRVRAVSGERRSRLSQRLSKKLCAVTQSRNDSG